MRRLSFPCALLFSALSGALLYLSFPHPSVRPLAWVALVPFFLACRGQGVVRGLALGFGQGLVFQSTLYSWAGTFGPEAMVLLPAFKALGPALAGASLGALPTAGPGRPFLEAATWVAMEFYQTLGPLGVTWGMLSHAMCRVPVLIQVGDLVGPWGLSFVLALVSGALAEALARRRPGPSLAGAAALAGGVVLYGAWRLTTPLPAAGEPLTWAVVQPSVPQDLRFDALHAERILARLEELTAQAAARGARVVVWPETSIPYRDFLDSPYLRRRLGDLAEASGIYLVVGSIEPDPAGGSRNTASLVTPDGRVAARYDKIRLVPFGEYLPWKELWPPLPVLEQVMDYRPGEALRLFGVDSHPFGVLICYESMVPTLPRSATRAGAQFLVIPTNDAWFEGSSAAVHHFDMAIMRAVENRRPAIQSGNTGLSGFVDAYGRVVAVSGPGEWMVLTADLIPRRGFSLYTRLGDWFAYACGAIWAGGWIGRRAAGLARWR